MSTKIKAGTATSGAVVDADATGILELQSGSTPTTAITVDASQNVGIGNTTPTSFYSEARNLVVGTGSGGQGLTIYSGSASQGRIMFANGTSGSQPYNGFVQYDQSANALAFGTNGGNERMRIDASGKVLIGSASNPFNSNLYVTATPTANAPIFSAYSQGGANVCGIGLYNDAASVGIWAQSGALTFRSNGNLASGSETMRIDSSGNLLVGTTSSANPPSQGVANFGGQSNSQIGIGHANGTGGGQYYLVFGYNGGAIGGVTQNGTTQVLYLTSSDYRLKENVAPITGALDRVSKLKPVTYSWKNTDNEVGEGFIAHELQEVCPLAVNGEKDAVNEDGSIKAQGIDTAKIVSLLTAAIQEQQAIITQLQADVAALKGAK
jgi:hypothetical protein